MVYLEQLSEDLESLANYDTWKGRKMPGERFLAVVLSVNT